MRSHNPINFLRSRFILPLALLNIFIFIIFFYTFFSTNPQQSIKHGHRDIIDVQKPHGKLLILMWTRVFGEQSMQLHSDCPLASYCEITYDKTFLPEASAIVFHIPDIKWITQLKTKNLAYDLPEVPDLPIRSVVKRKVNVFMSHENPSTLKTYYASRSLAKHVNNYFHWVMSYLHTSHISFPYGGFWVSPEETVKHGFTPVKIPFDANSILNNKTVRGILWLVSNCDSNSKRKVAVEALQKYINVTIGGKCGKTSADRSICPRNKDCSYLYSNYYFHIAIENDICRDYITEKFWDRYKLPSIPIVLRASIYQGVVPNNSYIAIDQFKSAREMANYLTWLMDNPSEYLKYFEWRSKGWSIAPWNHEGFRIGQCALCEQLLRLSNGSLPFPDTIPNAVDWFENNSHCEGGDFALHWSQQ